MKRKELLIGNYVLFNGKCREIYSVSRNENIKLIGDYDSVISCYLEGLKPIPLTEQWLLDFGFERFNFFPDSVSFRKGGVIYTKSSWLMKLISEEQAITLSDNIEYVHELQNIFYWLNDKQELTLTQ